MYASQPKYQILIKTPEYVGIKRLNNSNAFTECSQSMDDVCEDINDYNRGRKGRILVMFDDMFVDTLTNKNFMP